MPSATLYLRARRFLTQFNGIRLVLTALLLSGCCHTPTVNTNVNADGHMLTETPTPGNSGPLFAFTVPRHDADMGGPVVAMIDVDGLLLNMDMVGPGSAGENPVSLFRERLEEAAADPCTRALVVRINTYGGGVAASDIMRHDLEQFKLRTRLPVIACLLDTGAGGGYYIATAADHIVATPATITGGIGVILNLYNMEEFMKSRELYAAPVKAGENIDMGTQLHPTTEAQRALLERIANQFHERFKDIVLRSRPSISPAEEIFDGRIFTGPQALQLHLVDSLGYPDDAVATARSMAGLGDSRVVLYHRCNDRARTVYSITPNVPLQSNAIQMNSPGFDRAALPTFLYLWQPEPTMERLGGR